MSKNRIEEEHMAELESKPPAPRSESTTVTIVGVSNFAAADPRVLRSCQVMSYTAPSENITPSLPLNDMAVKVGNSLLDARVPESAFLRDESEDL